MGPELNQRLQHGVTYVAQVLKRNRTLKVLNVCDNKIDCAGLVALADALVSLINSCRARLKSAKQKYNNTLETLDLSKNPCCGPRVEGVRPWHLLHACA